MINIDGATNCNKCSHTKICSIKKAVNKAQSTALDVFTDTNESIEIVVRCKEYKEDVAVRTPLK